MVADTAAKTGKNTAKKAKDTTGTVSGGASPLADSVRRLAQTVTTRAATSLTDKVSSTAGRLGEYGTGGGGPGLLSAVTGKEPGAGRKAATGAVKGALSGVAEGIKDKISGALGGGGNDKIKVTNIVEHIDVGVPVDLAYDQWTRFTDFPGFLKKVEHVEQVSDEKLRWKAQIFWSHRSWESTIVEQVPDERIVWRSEGHKGHVDGAVTFHELAPDLTRVLLVLEYHPQGLFERTGNLWRAQGRRARLELKHFQRHVMTRTLLHPDDVEGWRGEIHDGRVVERAEDREPVDDTEAGDEEPREEREREGAAADGK
ncbi:SRPBCC family protein [Actinophytocola glycyrrhizae]|uniref:SRPBCC family protein n=1 Tax=Actinophytocola glycyrrhizae TaxID=2044873 RepID=A0ABV9RX19_9PSEU